MYILFGILYRIIFAYSNTTNSVVISTTDKNIENKISNHSKEVS